MTFILGISCFYHDSAACILKDGEVIVAVQEERLTRIKHDESFPENAVKNVLNYCKISLSEIDHIVFYEKPFLKFERLLETFIANAPRGFKQFKLAIPAWINQKLFLKKNLKNHFKKIDPNYDKDNLLFSNHHMSHAASAFYPSPYKNAAVLVVDAVGEIATTSIYIGDQNKLRPVKEIQFPHSLGLLYSAFTYYLGFKVNSGEYKVMGLAPYGSPKYSKIIQQNLIDIKNDGSFRLNQKFFNYSTGLTMISKDFKKLFQRERRNPDLDKIEQFHMDIAASIQDVTEKIMLMLCEWISKEFKVKNLCLAGGVALNCVANGKLYKKKLFENIWVQPAAGDAGGALGAALCVWYQYLSNTRLSLGRQKLDFMKGSYLGPKYENEEIEKDLKNYGAIYTKHSKKDLLIKTATLLSKSYAIGWFQGRMEFGPRALGNRSILADPRSKDMQKNLNLKVKFRESFRPFAPAVLYEDVDQWFTEKKISPYMLFVDSINEKIKKPIYNKREGFLKLDQQRSTIPSVTHVDFSARVQTVHKETNLIFYELISEFKKITKCSVLINTSFNVRGEPIVCTTRDAFNCFMGTNLDALVIGNFILLKNDQKLLLNTNYKNNFKLD